MSKAGLAESTARSYVARLRPPNATLAFALTTEDDPTPLLLPAVKALAAAHP